MLKVFNPIFSRISNFKLRLFITHLFYPYRNVKYGNNNRWSDIKFCISMHI